MPIYSRAYPADGSLCSLSAIGADLHEGVSVRRKPVLEGLGAALHEGVSVGRKPVLEGLGAALHKGVSGGW